MTNHGLQAMSIGFMIDSNDTPMVWRGPMVTQALDQLLHQTRWDNLDYLVVDLPPGTGDIQLTLAQKVPVTGAVIVTTPQEISLADVRKSINFCRRVKMDILGLVENMSGLKCPYCGKIIEVFKTLGGRETARKENLRLLATLPLELEVVREGDAGVVSLLDNRELLITREFSKMVDEVVNLTGFNPRSTSFETPKASRSEN
jgi:ATP-binding protein involved in chromosome partitioning